MSEVAELLKAWKQEREEQRIEQEEEKRHYEQRLEQQQEQLIQGLERRQRHIEVGPESLKLTASDDIEAFLTTFERAVEAHGVASRPLSWHLS